MITLILGLPATRLRPINAGGERLIGIISNEKYIDIRVGHMVFLNSGAIFDALNIATPTVLVWSNNGDACPCLSGIVPNVRNFPNRRFYV